MTTPTLTLTAKYAKYAFEDDMVVALFEGNRIASGPKEKFAEVEGEATKYLEGLAKERAKKAEAEKRSKATHIVTPNGLEGQIISSVKDVWGTDTVTVRLANNQIRHYEIHGGEIFEDRTAKATTPIEALRGRLDADYSRDKRSLASRIHELEGIRHEAATHIASGSSFDDSRKLSSIALAAEAEREEAREALAHLEQVDAEAFAPFKADFRLADASGIDGSHGTWLDDTINKMVEENEGEDLEAYLDEAPGQIAAEMDEGALADAEGTREMALAHITSKTAVYAGKEVDDYREAFLVRVEAARKAELADRARPNCRVASEAPISGPDDALFL